MKKKLQVFVSSTFTDMTEERQAAVQAILMAGHIPAGMELFTSDDKSQWDIIKRWIDDSDVFCLILGGRYGTIEKDSGKSYIELEYQYAIKTGKPLFAVVLSAAALDVKVRQKGREASELANGALYNKFRKLVLSRMSAIVDDIKDLKLQVALPLHDRRFEALPGWVRSSEVIDATAMLKRLEGLMAENEALQKQVTSTREPTTIELSPAAATLFLAAAATADGVFDYRKDDIGVQLRVGAQNLVTGNSRRERAQWTAAVRELVRHGIFEQANGVRFELTHEGWLKFEWYEKQKRDAATTSANKADEARTS